MTLHSLQVLPVQARFARFADRGDDFAKSGEFRRPNLRFRKSSAMRPCLFALLLSPALHAGVGFEKKTLRPDFISEGIAVADFNRDGHPDVIAGHLLWPGPRFDNAIEIAPPPATQLDPAFEYSNCFVAAPADVNADGWPDLIVTGMPGSATRLRFNPGKAGGVWPEKVLLDATDNESPGLYDLKRDGKPSWLCFHGNAPGFLELPWGKPAEAGRFHSIAPADPERFGSFTHGLGAGDLNGDGRPDVLVKDGWFEQPAEDRPTWEFHPVAFAPDEGGAQMLVFDANGDGRNDVVTSLNAHAYGLSWFEQKADGAFAEHSILSPVPAGNRTKGFSQIHALVAADLNRDGAMDFVTGKRRWAHGANRDYEPNSDAVLFWFEAKRDGKGGTEFIPHEIDRESGVGTQFAVTDLNGDGKPDIAVANKSGAFLFFQTVSAPSNDKPVEHQDCGCGDPPVENLKFPKDFPGNP
jgi:hypothetical protein